MSFVLGPKNFKSKRTGDCIILDIWDPLWGGWGSGWCWRALFIVGRGRVCVGGVGGVRLRFGWWLVGGLGSLTVSRRSFGDCLRVGRRGWLVRVSECLHTLPQVPDSMQAVKRGGLVGAGVRVGSETLHTLAASRYQRGQDRGRSGAVRVGWVSPHCGS